MGTFMQRVSPAVATPNPAKHVNYTLGMLLGADDFTQEFVYLSGRDQWLARDLVGYGTVSGLKVRMESSDKGPRVFVEPGAALSPRGQLIRVAPAQCASLNQWLASNRASLDAQIDESIFKSGAGVRLYVVLCYRECPTDMTPIPGEPCRNEDELMAASRVADDFRLELRFAPPYQEEEDALRDFVDWLSQVEITDTSTVTLEDFLKAIRDAAPLLAATHATPPEPLPSSPPTDFMFGPPPVALNIPAARACEYLRAALRVWVTELRPLWRPNWFGEWQCYGDKGSQAERDKEECLLLAELDVPITRVALTEEIKVDDTRDVLVNEERRPFLIHSRLLQEWLLCGRAAPGVAPSAFQPGPIKQSIVAAGTFTADGGAVFSTGGLSVLRNSADPTLYLLTGGWFNPGNGEYIVKGTPIGDFKNKSGQTFELMVSVKPGPLDSQVAQAMNGFGGRANKGIIVRVMGVGAEVRSHGFTVEISKYLPA